MLVSSTSINAAIETTTPMIQGLIVVRGRSITEFMLALAVAIYALFSREKREPEDHARAHTFSERENPPARTPFHRKKRQLSCLSKSSNFKILRRRILVGPNFLLIA